MTRDELLAELEAERYGRPVRQHFNGRDMPLLEQPQALRLIHDTDPQTVNPEQTRRSA